MPLYSLCFRKGVDMKILRLIVVLTFAAAVSAEPLPFRQAVELAAKRSASINEAERVRAHQMYLAAARMYTPQMTAGSGLAKTFGFPLTIEGSAPSVVNVSSTAFLINPGQREVVRAAHLEWNATTFSSEDTRQQAILDTVLTYTQLDRLVTALHLLQQQEQESVRAEQITSDRVQAGVDPSIEITRARLATARMRVAIAQVQGNVDVLRNTLAQLTGVPAGEIETLTESIPQLPEPRQSEDSVSKAASSNPVVKLAFAHADAQLIRARSEHKQLLPSVDFVGQYGLFAKYNNYTQYFKQFQTNNGLIGVAIRFNFLNLAQRSKAAAADAEAVQARRQAEDTKNKISNETRKLQRDVAQLTAAREVARLEYQLSRADVDTVQAKVEAGSATLRDEANARFAEGQKYSAYLDASYQVEQAEMQLLRSTGELEQWALSQK
jgi:outer membrane protein TolC